MRRADKPSGAPQLNDSATDSRTASAGRKKRPSFLPAAPALLGVGALVLAATGAVTLDADNVPSQITSGDTLENAAYAMEFSGSSTLPSPDTAADRERAASRDSQREALQATADEKRQDAADAKAEKREAALAEIAAKAEKAEKAEKREAAAKAASNAWSLPFESGAYTLTATFGETSSSWSTTHTGLDFAVPSGTPVKSVATGVVTSTAYDDAYGNMTIITDKDGTETWYCHQTSFSVNPGDHVEAGQDIGLSGATGNVTGPHLHLEVRPGSEPVDPFTALTEHGLNP